jgi:photosystem II stability/assembly factor-like uncharacterized protein
MSDDISFLAGQSSLWILPDGPNTKPEYLGCHGVGDIAEPLGDVTLKYCPDPAKSGAFVVKKQFRGEPGAVTTSIETDLRKVADYLEDLSLCGVPIFVHKVSCGRRDVFTNFDRSFILRSATITQRSLGNLAVRDPGSEDESTQSFDITATSLSRIFNLDVAKVSIAELHDITGIAICGEDRCEGDCGAATKVTDSMFAGQKHPISSALIKAEVIKSLNGAAWAETGGDPFAAGEDIQGIVCFRTGRDTLRVVVACGTTDGAAPMKIAYTDDNGATWTHVHVGSVNGEYCSSSHALFALDRYHMWIGSSGGRIYFSSDGGLSWTLQENAVISATAIMGVSFSSANVGFAVYTGGQVAKTTDGSQSGATWSVVTTSGCTTARDIHAISSYFVWVGGGAGKFYSHDAGVTWAMRDAIPTGALDFLDDLFGMSVGSAANGAIYMTINGGYDWQVLPSITNNGLNDVQIVSPKLAYVVGNASGGTGFMAKITPQV